ncbi:hypothetical protein ACFIQF_15360 [Comamonas sp. J-3]|uniref:hypothetical protein n=1 Tax=Comamonas trifloxystrobinivorans TaxID=3350256 RepID=UPI003728E945
MHIRFLFAASALAVSATAFAAPSYAPALERAVALEQKGEWAAARQGYAEVAELAQAEEKRGALLGLARVARAENRLSDARAIYAQLLANNASDVDATNGMAWLALANNQVREAQTGFQQALAMSPDNAEAQTGLQHAAQTFPYQLDVRGSWLNNRYGHLWGASANLVAALDSRQTVDVALRRNSADIGLLDQLTSTRLRPSTAVALGYGWQIPQRYGVRVEAEHVDRSGLSTQQRLGIEGNYQLTTSLRVSAGIRQSFGTGWRSQLRIVGLSYALGNGWEVATRVYSEHNKEFDTNRNAVAVEAIRHGPGHMLWVVGASHGTSPSATDVYARTVFPVGRQDAILATLRRLSLNHETQVELGWRKYWN